MKKILILDHKLLHHKNKIGIENILKEINNEYEFKYGNENDIINYDIIYSPLNPINTSNFPNKKFIFGPHFSIFPDKKLIEINNIYKNSIYIQPSQWVCDMWKKMNAEKYIPLKNILLPY